MFGIGIYIFFFDGLVATCYIAGSSLEIMLFCISFRFLCAVVIFF